MRNVSHIIRLALVTATAMMPLLVQAQSDDLGMWLGVSAEKQLGKGWSAEVEGEWRMKDNISATDRLSIGMTANYKFNKQHSKKLYYLFQDRKSEDEDESVQDQHVIGASYNFKF